MDPRAVVALFLFIVVYLLKHWTSVEPPSDNKDLSRFTYDIRQTWDGEDLDHDPVRVTLLPHNDAAVKIIVKAPFFNDPKNPGGEIGGTFPGLWDFEVVEVFFLNDKDEYVEVELCPHGQHLVLLLAGYRKPFKDGLPLEFSSVIQGDTWQGEAVVPAVYFPEAVTKMNAYAIHGSGKERSYEALYPTLTGKHPEPNFHRLEYFEPLDFHQLLPSNAKERYSSSLWSRSSDVEHP